MQEGDQLRDALASFYVLVICAYQTSITFTVQMTVIPLLIVWMWDKHVRPEFVKKNGGGSVRYFFVEGNIGSGKSSLLTKIQEPLQRLYRSRGTRVITVPEPLDKWQSIGNGKHNLLDAFYRDKKRWSCLFQSNAMVTRVQTINDAIATARRNYGPDADLCVLCERSIHTDRHVFVEALFNDGAMTAMERDVYIAWWNYWSEKLHTGRDAGIIYLRDEPASCYSRTCTRDRKEESSIAPTYFENLHALHESAIIGGSQQTWGAIPRLVFDVSTMGNIVTDASAVENCAKRLFDFCINSDTPRQ